MPRGKKQNVHDMKKRHKINPKIWRIILILIVLCLPVWYYLNFVVNRPGKSDGQTFRLKNEFTVGTVNIGGFRAMSTYYSSVGSFLLSAAEGYDLDILVVQEYESVYQFSEKEFAEMFAERYKYIYIEGEQAILSRYPILSKRYVPFADSHNSYAAYTLLVPGGRVDLFSVHFQTTGMSDLSENSLWVNLRIAYSLLTSNRSMRIRQARQLRQDIESSTNPVLVVGDFNTMPWTKVYRIVKRDILEDAFIETGHGNGATFRGLRSCARIDYIFHDRAVGCSSCSVCSDFFSDHRLLTATLSIK